MREEAFTWFGIISLIVIVAPIIFYGVTGGIIGFLLPCTPADGITIITYQASSVDVSCATVNIVVKLSVALWGTTVIAAGMFFVAAADLLGG